jgi:hypothetical protein
MVSSVNGFLARQAVERIGRGLVPIDHAGSVLSQHCRNGKTMSGNAETSPHTARRPVATTW